MTIFESEFHKRYVGGEGEVKVEPITLISPEKHMVRPTTLEEIRAEYRAYMHDPDAELPQGIVDTYQAIHRTENG